ncbi:MAG TPA: diguanylate cyclase [Gammaproteobacteria bacterium]|nr:diguanylate cyclase [Gammaproteobacteria bacterium]
MTSRILLALSLLLSAFPAGAVVAAGPVSANAPPDAPLGRYATYLKEPDGRLSLDQAIAAYGRGEFAPGRNRVLTFGIGTKPVWIHFSVANTTDQPLSRRLSIETAWLDRVDVYFRHAGKTVATYHVGDRQAFAQRPVDTRNFALDHTFPTGTSDVFVRVQTPDPMVVPIYLMSPERARDRQTMQDYSYGFLYGFLFALLAYNLMLYAGLRDLRYLFYSVYLGMFLLMNMSYTGHGFEWLWPTHVVWAQWSNPILMVLYGSAGLIFGLTFLETRRHFPRIHRGVLAYLGLALALLLLTVVGDSQRDALLVAFTFVFLFTGIMLAMGVAAVQAGQKTARYFLFAAFSAMVGAALTALSVWGFIPFNIWTFRAVDIGMLLDATLLALALTYHFRLGQQAKLRAEQLAMSDPLTGLNNRRAFYDITAPIWNIALRHDHRLSVVLLDIDNFKGINDVHGHACGDQVLREFTDLLRKAVRDQDVIARWGGEEFILLLPETEIGEAITLAERLRTKIAAVRIKYEGKQIALTASFGVAEREPEHRSLDAVISTADKYLYRSKDAGRNRVTAA